MDKHTPITIQRVANGYLVTSGMVAGHLRAESDAYVFETLTGLETFIDHHFEAIEGPQPAANVRQALREGMQSLGFGKPADVVRYYAGTPYAELALKRKNDAVYNDLTKELQRDVTGLRFEPIEFVSQDTFLIKPGCSVHENPTGVFTNRFTEDVLCELVEGKVRVVAVGNQNRSKPDIDADPHALLWANEKAWRDGSACGQELKSEGPITVAVKSECEWRCAKCKQPSSALCGCNALNEPVHVTKWPGQAPLTAEQIADIQRFNPAPGKLGECTKIEVNGEVVYEKSDLSDITARVIKRQGL